MQTTYFDHSFVVVVAFHFDSTIHSFVSFFRSFYCFHFHFSPFHFQIVVCLRIRLGRFMCIHGSLDVGECSAAKIKWIKSQFCCCSSFIWKSIMHFWYTIWMWMCWMPNAKSVEFRLCETQLVFILVSSIPLQCNAYEIIRSLVSNFFFLLFFFFSFFYSGISNSSEPFGRFCRFLYLGVTITAFEHPNDLEYVYTYICIYLAFLYLESFFHNIICLRPNIYNSEHCLKGLSSVRQNNRVCLV